jgi:hypothetical protein
VTRRESVRNLVQDNVTNLIRREDCRIVLGESNLLCEYRVTDTHDVGGTEPTLRVVELKGKATDAVRGHQCLGMLLNLVKFHAGILSGHRCEVNSKRRNAHHPSGVGQNCGKVGDRQPP